MKAARSSERDPESVTQEADLASELLELCAGGDSAAFGRFYDLVIGRTFGVVTAIVEDNARSEELVQHVMVEVWRRAPSFDRAHGSAVCFAVKIAHVWAAESVLLEPARSPQENGDRDATSAALRQLPTPMRDAVVLALFGGRSRQQVATLLAVPIGTVESCTRTGLARLGADLEAAADAGANP